MALRYDFDIVRRTLAGAGGSDHDGAIAMFRDPETVRALEGASPAVRRLFVRSGFALEVNDSGMPEGCYSAKDEDDRAEIIERLAINFSEAKIDPADTNGFDFGAFLELIDEAEPIDDEDLPPRPADPLDSLILDTVRTVAPQPDPAPVDLMPAGALRLDPDVGPSAPALDYDPWAEPKKGAKLGALGLSGFGLPNLQAKDDDSDLALPGYEAGALDRAALRAEVRAERGLGGIAGLFGSPAKAFGSILALLAVIALIKS